MKQVTPELDYAAVEGRSTVGSCKQPLPLHSYTVLQL